MPALPSVDEPVLSVEVPADEEYVAENDASDHRQALLRHVEILVELEQARTKGLKEAARVCQASVEGVLGAYQVGLESYLTDLKSLVGL